MSLRLGQELETVEHGQQQLMKSRKGEAGLGDGARRGHNRDPAAVRPFPCGREQGRLADPRLTTDDDRAATFLDPIDERVQVCQLPIASEEF
jgi:hypothetical protein